MIKSDKQLEITKFRLMEFKLELTLLEKTDSTYKILYDSIQSQIETFEFEINEYKNRKNIF